MSQGFIKLTRADDTLELLKDHNAFVLLTVIALRARRTEEFNVRNLRPGEALIGDYARYGMSRQQYRSAQRRLRHWGFASFKPTTNGTIATLLDERVYDVNIAREKPSGGPGTTIAHPSSDRPATTTKKHKKEKKEKKYSADSDEWRISELLLRLIVARKPDLRKPDLSRWAHDVGRMILLDGRTPEQIEPVVRWCQQDPFWQNNILSTAKLRKHFDRLELEMGRHAPTESTRQRVARMEREGTL